MPKKKEAIWDPQQRKWIGQRDIGTDESVTDKAKLQDTSGLGAKVTGAAFIPPKMEPNESSSAYSARVAAARRAWEAKQKTSGAQADAIGMKK